MISENSTNMPNFLAHMNLVTNLKHIRCGTLHVLNENESCEFVKNVEACRNKANFIDYLQIIYCVIGSSNEWTIYLFIALLIIWFCYLLQVVLDIVYKFLLPALIYTSKLLKLGDSLTGATLLPVGFMSARFLGDYSQYRGDTDRLFVVLYGRSIFVIGFVAGLVLILQPMTVAPMPITRDIIFFAISCIYMSVAFDDEIFTYSEAIGILAIYSVYLFLLMLEYWYYDGKSSDQNSQSDDSSIDSSNEPASKSGESMWKLAIEGLKPFTADEWNAGQFLTRVMLTLRAPILFLLRLIIPVVDEKLPRNGWNRLLNSVQIVLLPMVCKYLTGTDTIKLNVFHLSSVLIAALVLLTSDNHKAPTYHWIFAIFGSIYGAVVAIGTASGEHTPIMEAVGTYYGLSRSFIGLSVLAWGNEVGALVTNISLAITGRAQMAFRSCFSSSMYNTVLTIGLIFLLSLIQSGKDEVIARKGEMGPVLSVFLYLILVNTLTTFFYTKYQGRRSVGAFLLTAYCIFFIFCILCEFEIMHSYGTDHYDEY